MSQKLLINIYEYSSFWFSEPLDLETSLQLSKRSEEVNTQVGSPVLELLYKKNQLSGIRVFQFVGVIQVSPRFVIQIIPKMSSSIDDTQAWRDSIHNLLYMLQYTGKMVSAQLSGSQLKSFKGDFYEILIHLFATTLISEIRNSLHHEYIDSEQNLSFLRGKLMFSEHILHNGVTQEKFYVTADNFESDNKLNRIFAYVVRRLVKQTRQVSNRKILHELQQMLVDIPNEKMTVSDAERVHINRMNDRFKPALDLAKLFLSDESLQLSQGSFDTATYLINMNELFEDYITAVCKKVTPDGYATHAQGPRKYLVSSHRNEAGSTHRQLFQMKPDISVVKVSTGAVVHIIDTKYKILDKTQARLGVSQADMYQVYSYSNKYNAPIVTLLYPRRSDQGLVEAVYRIDDTCTVVVKTIDLNRDLKRFDSSIRRELSEVLNGEGVNVGSRKVSI